MVNLAPSRSERSIAAARFRANAAAAPMRQISHISSANVHLPADPGGRN